MPEPEASPAVVEDFQVTREEQLQVPPLGIQDAVVRERRLLNVAHYPVNPVATTTPHDELRRIALTPPSASLLRSSNMFLSSLRMRVTPYVPISSALSDLASTSSARPASSTSVAYHGFAAGETLDQSVRSLSYHCRCCSSDRHLQSHVRQIALMSRSAETSNNSDEATTQCSICWGPFDTLTSTPCGHLFCTPCILQYFIITRNTAPYAATTCPACRKPATAEGLRRLYL